MENYSLGEISAWWVSLNLIAGNESLFIIVYLKLTHLFDSLGVFNTWIYQPYFLSWGCVLGPGSWKCGEWGWAVGPLPILRVPALWALALVVGSCPRGQCRV